MKVIAIEEHFLTPDVQQAWSTVSGADDGTFGLNRGNVSERLANLGEDRLALMDETGVDVQVLSLTTPWLNNLGDRSVDMARKINDLVASTVANHPARFQGLATLPSTKPDIAARELERSVVDLGLKGVMLYGRVGDKNLDHEIFWPTFECVEELQVPLLIHPQIPQQKVRDAYYSGCGGGLNLALSTFGIGWHYETGIQFVRLVVSGVFDRYPKLQVILGHWGELVIFYLERLSALDGVAKRQRPFEDYVRNNLFLTASGMFSEPCLRRSVEAVGMDRILFSTDFPYQYRPGGNARRFLSELSLDVESKEKFAHRNWER